MNNTIFIFKFEFIRVVIMTLYGLKAFGITEYSVPTSVKLLGVS